MVQATAPAATESRIVDARGLGLYAVVVFSWGVSWIALKAQLGTVAPEVSVLWRFAIAALLMFAWVAMRGDRMRFRPAEHLRFAAIGVLMFSMNFVLFYYGGLVIPSGLLAVVFSLASIGNLLLAALVLGQAPSRRVALGGVLGAAGIGLLYLPEITGRGFDAAALIGLGLCVVGTLSFCLGNIVASTLQRRAVPLLSANAWGMAYGVLFLLALCLARGRELAIEPTPSYLGALLFLAIVSSVIAFAAYLTLLRRMGAARAGYATVMFPIVALTVSTFVENYSWSLPALLGAGLALFGNVLVLTRGRGS